MTTAFRPPERTLGHDCPYCGQQMAIARMACGGCGVAVEGVFAMTRLGSLAVEHQRFIEMFVLAGGNLKQIAEQAGVSYPTVRSRLDRVIDALRQEIAKTQPVVGTMLDALQTPQGEEPSAHAARLIKEI